MKRTIIYVFGPRRLFKKYVSNQEISLEEGGWLKIGKANTDDINIDKWDVAKNRINQEVHTGIPEICQIYDVFEYPAKNANIDDIIRKILAEDVYQLETSKLHNRALENYEIKAGREFVYGVKRSQLLNAIAKYERDLMLEHYSKQNFDKVVKMVQSNIVEIPFEIDSEKISPNLTKTEAIKWNDNLWSKVVDRLKNMNISYISNPLGRPYISIKSPSRQMSYALSYSIRYALGYVAIETFQGESAREEIEQFISNNANLSQMPFIKKQGSKNKEKWAWLIDDTLDKSDNELVEWYTNVFMSIYSEFEN